MRRLLVLVCALVWVDTMLFAALTPGRADRNGARRRRLRSSLRPRRRSRGGAARPGPGLRQPRRPLGRARAVDAPDRVDPARAAALRDGLRAGIPRLALRRRT